METIFSIIKEGVMCAEKVLKSFGENKRSVDVTH